MRTVKFIATAVLALVLGVNVSAQAQKESKSAILKTETTKVLGNCETCKARIEKALKMDGVSKADWNDDSKILTITYDPKKITMDEIQKKVASVGHDTEKFKADDKVYAKLPGCCQYR